MHIRRFIATLVVTLVLLLACSGPITSVSPKLAGAIQEGASASQLFIYPDDGQQLLLDTIAAAKQRVLMKMYLVTDTRVITALETARKNGAVVRAMVEQHPFGGGPTALDAYSLLRQAGIETKYSNPAFRYTHEKSFVIDNTAIILTANMTQSAFAHNREFGVVDTDAGDVAEIIRSFEADWSRTAFLSTSPFLVWSPINARARINAVIGASAHSLMVYAEEAQDDDQGKQLGAAVSRGVDVRLLISPPIGGALDGNAAGLDIMQGSGVRVRYLKQPYVHAKMLLADNQIVFIGSQNISTGSLEFNRELGILISDTATLQRLSSTFEHDWSTAVDR